MSLTNIFDFKTAGVIFEEGKEWLDEIGKRPFCRNGDTKAILLWQHRKGMPIASFLPRFKPRTRFKIVFVNYTWVNKKIEYSIENDL